MIERKARVRFAGVLRDMALQRASHYEQFRLTEVPVALAFGSPGRPKQLGRGVVRSDAT